MNTIIVIYMILWSDSIWARSLKATADKLGQETTRIGISLAMFGIVVGGIYFVLGKNDAGQRMTQALLGSTFIVCATAIVSFIQGLA